MNFKGCGAPPFGKGGCMGGGFPGGGFPGGPRPGMPGMPGRPGMPGMTGKGGFEDEDRSRDWFCGKCQERNFAKRGECFKCQAHRPADGGLKPPSMPQSGTTLNGMVKSYNRKGFGFLMVLGMEQCQDIYYTRENLSPKLQTRDIPGQHVTFEIHRYPDGKMTALNIRPIGEDRADQYFAKGKMPMMSGKGSCMGGCGGFAKGGGFTAPVQNSGMGVNRDEEDRSRDWNCANCGERNFVKRFECFKCKETRSSAFSEPAPREVPIAPRRTLSPHAGARAIREALRAGGGGAASRSSSGSRGRKRKRSSSGSDSSSSSEKKNKHKRKKGKKKKKKKNNKSRSASSSKSSHSVCSSSGSSSCRVEGSSSAPAGDAAGSTAASKSAPTGNPEVEKAKAEALEQLMKLRSVQPKETRMSEFRALLRKWHPDKNPDKTDVATAVFQFLQKGKQVLEAASA
mmetsp:Transcript_76683/g.197500  ORF Transcript_76683/g.197500 Transcript_76683/m.197500 type:complete len:455 (+) Transcript_76683:133-1497(+)